MPIFDPYYRHVNPAFLPSSVSDSNTTSNDDKQFNIYAALLPPLVFFLILYLCITFCKRYNKPPALNNISYSGSPLQRSLEPRPPYLEYAEVNSPIAEEAPPTYSEVMELQAINLTALFANNNASSLQPNSARVRRASTF